MDVTTDAGSCFATVDLGTPVTGDNCGVASVSNDAPAQFVIGTTTVTWTVTDNYGNTATCEQLVTVEDNEAPVIDCTAIVNVIAEQGQCGAWVSLPAPEFSDNCATDVIINDQTGTSDATNFYPVGQTEVTWSATDLYGNLATCVTVIIIDDAEAPSIECPQNITMNAEPGLCGATVTYDLPSFDDNCEGATIALTEGLPSGDFFIVGETTIAFTATDAAGNTTTCSFTVTVLDAETPEVMCTSDITVENDLGLCGAMVTYDLPVGYDNCAIASIELTTGLASGSVFPVGSTVVEYTATDLAGNTSTCSFTVEVVDTEAPVVLGCPNDLFVSNDNGECGAVVNYAMPVATDNCGDVITELLEGPEQGGFFAVGTTEVTYRFTDSAGNTSTCTFSVTVVDDELPIIDCLDTYTVSTDPGLCGAFVDYPFPDAFDNCGGVTVAWIDGPAPGAYFETGETLVSFIATDAAGNTNACSYLVIVNDTEAPVIECPEDIIQIDPVVDYDDPDFSDNCFAGITMTAGLPSGSEFPHGYTTITFVAEDLAGNLTECSFEVLVNTPPVAENDSAFYNWNDEKIVIDVTLNDHDPDGDDFSITDATAQHGNVQISFGNLVYIAPDGWCGTDTITYVICDIFNACDTALVVVEVECDYEIFIPEGFSPNGDGVNDLFEIVGLHRYPNNRVTIFNRWGRKVYDARNYQNDWDGRSQDALTLGTGTLPEGTYFVVLDLIGSGLKPVKGYVYINH
jgi:gliding motility-associated-like protein